jgi:allene oxide cyclase
MTMRMAARFWAGAAMTLLATGALADTTIRVVERATTDRVSVHGGAAADNLGDILTFANPVYDAADKVRLGMDQGYCVRVILGHAFECHWILSLAAGQLTVDGPFLDSGDSVLAVTGGTGAYGGARGEMRLHARDAKGSAYDFVYRLK